MATNVEYQVEERDVEYQRQAGKPWLARIYQPRGSGPFPTMVDVHGGAWHNGDRTNNAGVDRALAAKGVVVAALDFHQPPEAGYPASICDVNLAVRWLKAHAAEFNGTTAVGAFGNSSGGHQVVLSALRPRHAAYSTLPLPNHPEIDASIAYVIAAWPVICPLYRFRFAKEFNREEHINAHIEYWGNEDAMAEGSPQTILDKGEKAELPPILFLMKANDKNHPLEMQERFITSYRKRGGAIEVDTFDGLPEHRMVPSPSEPETMRFIEVVSAFIRQQSK
ncbi:MAG TPA: alpha/beta hydrolase [Candidatus Limnocylindria bacterium]|nr:alpha/beta hydrolase [Candidatus Limnocylindria bacterium]